MIQMLIKCQIPTCSHYNKKKDEKYLFKYRTMADMLHNEEEEKEMFCRTGGWGGGG